MTNDSLSHLAKLYELISTMEEDLGLDTLSEDERALVYAITAVSDETKGQFLSAEIKKHTLCKRMTHPTFYRNLKRLLAKGIIKHVKGKRSGAYEIAFDRLPTPASGS